MPHIITSRSTDNERGIGTTTIADIKISVLERAIDRIKYVDLG
jgi:hypothetical protein